MINISYTVNIINNNINVNVPTHEVPSSKILGK